MSINPAVIEKYPELSKYLEGLLLNTSQEGPYWDERIIPYLTVVDAAPNKIVFEFKIDKVHCNMMGSIHGGCIATLIDFCSTCALVMYDGKFKWKGLGVTTDLSVSYMRGMRVSQIARLECVVQRCGKNLCNLYTEVLDENGTICYAGSHTKFSIDNKL